MSNKEERTFLRGYACEVHTHPSRNLFDGICGRCGSVMDHAIVSGVYFKSLSPVATYTDLQFERFLTEREVDFMREITRAIK